MGVGAAVRSFQVRICSSRTKDSPFIHVSTKCVIALTLVLVILSGKRGSWIFFFSKYPSSPAPSIQNQMVAPSPMTNVVNFRCIESHRFLLWFTISVIVCLCMYVLVKILFWTPFGHFFFGKKLSFWLSACSVLIVVHCFTCVLFSFWCLGWKVLGNCINF